MSRPYFKLFSRDFRDGVRPLTLEETGAYTLLLTLIYDAGGPIDDDGEAIRRQLCCDRRVWARVRARLLKLGKIELTECGRLTNGRAEREIAEAQRLSEVRAAAGRAGGWHSGQVRGTYGTSPRQVRDKSGKSPAYFSDLVAAKALKNKESAEAIASKPYSESTTIEEYYATKRARDEPPPDRSPPTPTPAAPSQRPTTPPDHPDTVLPLAAESARGLELRARVDRVYQRCVEAAGPSLADPAKYASVRMSVARTILPLLDQGYELELDIVPVIEARTACGRREIRSFEYLRQAFADQRSARLQPPPAPNPQPTIGGRDVRAANVHDFAGPRTYAQRRAAAISAEYAAIRAEYGLDAERVGAMVVG